MKRKVTVTLRATMRHENGERETQAYTVPGTMEETAEGRLLVYDEPADLGLGRVTTALAVSEACAVLTRTGAVRCGFRFETGAPHHSVYETALGSFPAQVCTHMIRSRLGERGGLIELRYTLTIGGATGEHRLKILVRTEMEA